MKEVYTRLVDLLELSEPHREELSKKRGFSPETIKACKFKSCGPDASRAEADLLAACKEADLVASGVFIRDQKGARMNPMLFDKRILIPYLDPDGSAYFVRPHKLGLKGVPIEIYQTANLASNPHEIVLTEGEFKAAAGMQYGVPTIAIPGISSFSETHFPKLLEALKAHKVRRIVIAFDNETKDNPALPQRFKPSPSDRYDTQFYAYYMASRLEKEGAFDVAIATLPDGWKHDGKIDIDGALAQGRPVEDLRRVFDAALPRNEYLGELTQEARAIVLRKRAQKRHASSVRREFNHYVATRRRGKTEWPETVSNFVINIVATHDTIEGMRRVVQFVNEFGRRSRTFVMTPEDMSSPDAFRRFCYEKGPFSWRGSLDDLLTIWETEFLMMDEERYIVESDHLGWLPEEKLWLFGNVAIRDDGTEKHPDQDGTFWIDDKKGVKPTPLMISSGKNAIAGGIPYLSKGEIDVREIRRRLEETIGRNEAAVLLGWISAIPFMEEAFADYGSFPFLFITGRWQSGKSTVARWCMQFFGIEQEGLSISQTTPVAIQRSLSYYSCLPVWLDEYRNTKEVKAKDGFLRNVYNRQSSGKGMKADFGLRDAKVRGTLIISGEETPKDGALLTRCITIFVSRQKRAANHFNWFMANRGRFSAHTLSLIRRRKDLVPEFRRAVEEWKEFFSKEEIDDRMAINYATIVAGHWVAFGDKDVKFAEWLTRETKEVQSEQRDEQAVSVFLDDLMAMKTRGLVDDRFWDVDAHDGEIRLYFHGLHQVWAEQFRKSRGDEAFKEGSIRSYLKEEPGFLRSNEYARIKGELKKCIIFDGRKAPVEIQNLAGWNGHMTPVFGGQA